MYLGGGHVAYLTELYWLAFELSIDGTNTGDSYEQSSWKMNSPAGGNRKVT